MEKLKQLISLNMRLFKFIFFLCLLELLIFASFTQQFKDVSKILAASVSAGYELLLDMYTKVYRIVGPTLFPLVILSIVQLILTLKIVRKFWLRENAPARYCMILESIESLAPCFGFLGTVISLLFTMLRLNPGLPQSEMLESLINNSASAFGSTIYGILLAIVAYIAKRSIEFLPQENKEPSRILPSDQTTINTLNKGKVYFFSKLKNKLRGD